MRVACLVAGNAQTRTANFLLLDAIIIGTGVVEVISTWSGKSSAKMNRTRPRRPGIHVG
jgi:hypothetical protein